MYLQKLLNEVSTSDLSVYFKEVQEIYLHLYGGTENDTENEYKEKIKYAFFVLQKEIYTRVSTVVENISLLK